MSQPAAFKRSSTMNQNEKQVNQKEQKDSKVKKISTSELVDDFNKNCKIHLESDTLIFACITCKKFVCTRCYCKSHRDCFCNLTDLMYNDIREDNESNLKLLLEMKEEFSQHLDLIEKKNDYIIKNNPFDCHINLINKIFDDIVKSINNNRKKAIDNMTKLKETYMKNINNNIEKVRDVLEKSDKTGKGLQEEIEKMKKQSPFEFCKDYIIDNRSDLLAETCEEIKYFSEQDFTNIKQSFIDTNTIIFNDSNILVDQCKNFREYLGDKITNFYTNYEKYEKKYAYTVVMNKREFIVYLIEDNKVNIVNYTNDFIIPSYARWIEISGDKLLLTGGEKDFIESLNSTYLFKFSVYDSYNQNGFQAKVSQKADMLYKRRAHSLIYFNDYIYAISGVDKKEMIKTCEKYDIFNDKWIEVPGLNYPRQNAALAIHNQRYLYAFAGYDGHKNVDSYEKLDILNEQSGWTIMDIKNAEKDCDSVDVRKNRMGIIPLDFDTILIFGGERGRQEYKDAYIYEFFENKFFKFSDMYKNSNFITNPIYYGGKYILFDFLNNIHELNLDTMMFEYHVFNKDMDAMNL